MSTTTERSLLAAVVAAFVFVGAAPPVLAAPAAEAPATKTAEAPAPERPPATPTSEATSVDAALESGDLATAAALAKEQRKKDPTPANWRTEAEVAETRGDLQGATAAYAGLLDALPLDADAERARAEKDLQRVQGRARGTVSDEPASTHRDELDAKWAKPTAKPKKKAPRRVVAPPPRTSDDRIVTKWYFWVTVGAIVASAAAVTGIAIQAARDDDADALGLAPGPAPMGPSILRF